MNTARARPVVCSRQAWKAGAQIFAGGTRGLGAAPCSPFPGGMVQGAKAAA
jgi:hypothetical protein